jgi:large subunit ribosomal protein L24
MQAKLHIKKGDTVRVISGEHKGKEGLVVEVDRKKNRVKVEGVNLVKKHSKPSAKQPQGGIVEMEAGLHISNVMLLVNGIPTRVGRKNEEGKLVRYAKKNGEVIK